jgi:hypothetical protein
MRSRSGWRETGWRVALALAAALGVAGAPVPARSQGTHKPSASDYFATLRVGQWIQLNGNVRDTTPVLCTEVKQLAGDFLDDDWSIKGAIQTLDTVRQEFVVGGCRIQVTGGTTYDDPHRRIKGLGDLRIGMRVDVEGTFLRERSLVAAEVDDESEELVHHPALKDALEIVGRVERIDPRQRLITVMGVAFQVTDKTKLRSAIQ